MEPMKRILCPVDFSETSSHALAVAEKLAIGLSAEVVLAHVFDRALSLTMAGQNTPADAEVQRQLDNLRLSSSAIPVRRIMHVGEPGEVVCWLAESQNCDLIVLGTHGRRGLLHMLLGSVAEYVMRNARCPVMTVRLIPEKLPPLKEPLVLPVAAPRFM